MAIIYTYPTKATPVDNDLILISDSADSNKTKQVTVASIKGQTAGVTSVAATLPLVASAATGDTTLSLSGLSALGTAGQVIKVNSGATALEFGTISVGGLPIEEEGTEITSAAAKINFTGTGATASANGNDITVNIPAMSIENSGSALISGITTLNFGTNLVPVSAGPGTNKVTIDASGGGGGISFSGTTVNGIATYSNSTTATVSSAFTVSGNKLSAPAGTLADPSIEVGAIGGLYAASGGILLAHNGANAIGVTSASTLNYKLTQFNAGLKFGSAGSTLSNYEFGTWTPTVYSPSGSWSGTASTGYYEVVGDMVRAYFKISTTNYPANYPMNINNLPIVATTTAAYLGGVQVYTNTSSVQVGRATTGIITGANIVQFKTLQTSGNVNELIDSKYQPTGATGTLEGLITYKKS